MASQEMVWATAILVAVYMVVILYFVVRGARRTKSMADYALGNMTFSPWFVGLSLAAASTSAATFIINPGFIALYGWSAFLAFAVFLPLGKYLSLVLMTKRFRKQGMSAKSLSMGQWIGSRYASKNFGLFFAVLSLLLITFKVLICVGMTKVLSQALNIGEITALAGIVTFVFGYMMFGGANSMVYTNTIQAFLKLAVAIILLGSGYKYLHAGFEDFWQQIAAIDPLLTATVNPGSPLFRDYFEIMFCPFVVGIAIVCQPHIITKSFFLKKESDVNKYLLVGIAAEVIFFSVVFVGLYARLASPDMAGVRMDSIMPSYVVREFSIWTALIIILGLLSSGLATLEGLIQSLSTTITNDILGAFFWKNTTDNEEKHQRKLIFYNKIVAIGLAIVTFLLARDQLLHPKLSVGIFAQLGVYAFFSTAFVPVLFGIFFKDTPRVAVIVAALVAVTVHFGTYYGGFTHYLQGTVRNPAVAATYAILSSVTVGLLLHFLLKKNKT
jgi:sodium/pantothenate symporter